MNRFVKAAIGTIMVVSIGIIVALVIADVIDYTTDPRPAMDSEMCRIKQEEIFKRPITRNESPSEFVREVRNACK